MSANPDSTCDFKRWKEIYEKFFVLCPGSIAFSLLQDRWFSWSRKCEVSVHPVANYNLDIGGMKFDMTSLESDGFRDGNDIIAIYNAYCVERLSLYKPLIYLTAFGHQSTFEALLMCIKSIEAYGEYDGEFLILTDRKRETIFDLLPESVRSRTSVKNITAFDVIDYVSARFEIVNLPEYVNHQPIVYTDVDVICTATLTPLLEAALDGRAIYARMEGGIDQIHYGSVLIEGDICPRIRSEYGFNSGVIAFRDTSQARRAFKATLASLKSHLRHGLDRSSTEAYDQPVANHVFNAIAEFDVKLLIQHVHPCLPGHDDSMDSRGLVHFFGGVGASHKIDRMRRFLNRINSKP